MHGTNRQSYALASLTLWHSRISIKEAQEVKRILQMNHNETNSLAFLF